MQTRRSQKKSPQRTRERNFPRSWRHNKFVKAMGLPVDKERPIDNKAAKRQKVEEKSYASMQSARNDDFKSAMAGTDRLATVMENKAIHEMWFRMSAMFLKMGDQAKSVEFLRQIEEDQKKDVIC
jgi:hypothetical protein